MHSLSLTVVKGHSFSNLDLFEADPGYFLLAQDDPEFFVLLHNSVSLAKVPSTLAYELLELGLNKEELIEVLSDIIEGPLVDEPEVHAAFR